MGLERDVFNRVDVPPQIDLPLLVAGQDDVVDVQGRKRADEGLLEKQRHQRDIHRGVVVYPPKESGEGLNGPDDWDEADVVLIEVLEGLLQVEFIVHDQKVVIRNGHPEKVEHLAVDLATAKIVRATDERLQVARLVAFGGCAVGGEIGPIDRLYRVKERNVGRADDRMNQVGVVQNLVDDEVYPRIEPIFVPSEGDHLRLLGRIAHDEDVVESAGIVQPRLELFRHKVLTSVVKCKVFVVAEQETPQGFPRAERTVIVEVFQDDEWVGETHAFIPIRVIEHTP